MALSVPPALAASRDCLVHFQVPLLQVNKEQECVSAAGQRWDFSGLVGGESGEGEVWEGLE